MRPAPTAALRTTPPQKRRVCLKGAALGSVTATLDGVVHIDFGQVERGHEAKQKSRADRDGRQVNKYLRIHRKIEPCRFRKPGDAGIQPMQSGEGNYPSEQATG